MIKGAVGKVMWVGRATALPVVLAVMLVLVFGTTPASAHGGYKGVLHLGHSKAAAKATTLVGQVATGEALVVKNPSGGSALGLSVGDPLANPATKTVAPMKVDSQAKVANLNADKLDGMDSAAFWRGGTYTLGKYVSGTANGITTATHTCNSGDKLLSGGYYMFGTGFEVFTDIADTNTYYLYWKSGATATNATLYAHCADF